jgi:type II secretory pathway component GspD/PulD (secretin)
MDIQADVEQIGGYQEIQGVGEVPTTTKRQAGAKVAVRDGETIMLGGFISDSRSTTHSGVPWLMDIPFLGNLFKNTALNNARTELVMLMRPTVLPTPASAAVVASEERNKLSAVKEAEWQMETDSEDRSKRIDAEMAKAAKERAEKARKEALKEEKNASEPSTNAPPIMSVPPIEDTQ